MAELSVPTSNQQLEYKDTTVQDLDRLLSMARGARSRFEPTWHLNYAYYFGEQWLFWNRGRLDRPRLDPHRVTITDNRIIGIVRTELAKMTKQKPAFQVLPTSAQTEDVQAAEMGEKVLEYLWRHLHMRDRLIDVLLWSRITGAGFWKITWDNAAGKKVQVLTDTEGKPVLHGETEAPMHPSQLQDDEGNLPEGLQAKTIATGDVHVETVAPFEFLADPIAWRLEDAEWCIQENVKSQEYVRQHYGMIVPTDTDIAPGPTEARMFPSYQMGGTSNYKGVKLHEYWCKPNDAHPEGRRAVWSKGKILFEGPNPYKELPYVMFSGIQIPGRFWPTSTVEQLRQPQTELNKIRSQILENAQRLGNPAITKSRQANTQYSGTPGEIIDYDDNTQNAVPAYLQPPNMPAYVIQQQEKIEASMEAIAGQHEVSNAQVPAGVKAASAINLLQEADDTRLGPSIYDMEETIGYAGSRLLKIVSEYWTDERLIMIAGEDHALDARPFRGAFLRGNTHAEVQSGSMFPKSKAAKQASIESILALAFQYGLKVDDRMIGKILNDLEAGALGKVFGDISKDEQQVNRENQELSEGLPIEINAYDNHEAHIDGHQEFQKGSTYKQLGPLIGQMVEEHINEHRRQLLAAQQGMMGGQSKPPAESLNYKDAPPDIRRQIEAQAGLEPSKMEALEVKQKETEAEPPNSGKPTGGKQ